MTFINRCVFIEGIGRCHVMEIGDEREVAAWDAVSIKDQINLGLLAQDILDGRQSGEIRWSVRFREHQT